MPLGQYDRYFGGKGSAKKTLQSMKRTYGDEKGEQVFYATVAKRERKAARRNSSPAPSRKPQAKRRSPAHRWLHGS